jgi:hypothetical protein
MILSDGTELEGGIYVAGNIASENTRRTLKEEKKKS